MSESDTLWRRDGRNVEDLPDPFGLEAPDLGQPGEQPAAPRPSRRRYWKYGLYALAGLLLVTLIWLIVTAPLPFSFSISNVARLAGTSRFDSRQLSGNT